MKALTLRDDEDAAWATLIERGKKTIETRTWPTKYRGDLLITASKSSKHSPGLNAGMAICVVEVYDCVPMERVHEEAACCPVYMGAWAWKLRNLRWLSEKFPVKGKLQIFEVEVPDGISIVPARLKGVDTFPII